MVSNLYRFESQFVFFNELASKWTDSFKRDTKLCGIGTTNNQLQRRDGSKSEMHSPEDRSFAYVLKDNSIYAYGLLDGFNGSQVVDYIEQTLLLNFYFDHLNDEDFEKKSDGQIFGIIKEQFRATEEALEKTSSEKLNDRTLLSFRLAELTHNDPMYRECHERIKQLDNELSCGAFVALALIVGQRLFTVNVGTTHCFLYSISADGNNSILPLAPDHTISNADEELRIKRLNGVTRCDFLVEEESIKHTRCLGDFKTKLYYNELDQFKYCSNQPIISDPEHHFPAIKLTDDFLFMVMYSDALGKAIEKTGLDAAYVDEKIAQMLLEKIKTEVSLNSAAQSVVDDIKRAHDEYSRQGELVIREDLTLIVRTFNENLRELLNDSYFTEQILEIPNAVDSLDSTIYDLSITNRSTNASEIDKNADFFDSDGFIKPYIDFSKFNKILETDKDTKSIIEGFEKELEELVKTDDNSRL